MTRHSSTIPGTGGCLVSRAAIVLEYPVQAFSIMDFRGYNACVLCQKLNELFEINENIYE